MSSPLPDDNSLVPETARQCAIGLEGLGDGFLASFHGRENDFLRLGRDLEGFNTKASEVSSLASELAGLTAGEALATATASLASHLERLGDTCTSSVSQKDIASLETVANMGLQLVDNMRDFTRLVKHLTMLGIATRIESARLGSQGMGFSTLSDDVEKLAGKIASSSEKILSRSRELVSQCRDASKSIDEMNISRNACSRSATEVLQADLSAMEALQASSRETAADIASEALSMVQSVSEAVHSMQFHDIIRQQLEHVAEAADEARAMAMDGPMTQGGHNAESWEELAGWVKSVLVLQESQLGNARTRFAEAMQSLGSGLSGIALRVGNMAARAEALASQEGGQGGVLGRMDDEVRQIAQALRDYAMLERRMCSVMRAVSASISDMSTTVAEIEEVGSEIELIAINASVKAAHTGEEGKALGVLASAIQKLSVDARMQTDRILDLLSSVDASSLELAGVDSFEDKDKEFESVLSDLNIDVAGIKLLESKAAELAGRVQRMASSLSGEISHAIDSLDFQRGLLDDMAAAQDRFGQLVDSLQRVLPAGAEFSQSPKLREMLARYTMDAERLVHESALGITSSVSSDQPEGEYGDNVELF
ncbi:MAG: methyl-accepting chemotaxis protein [Acidobacteriota bacterium]